MKTTNNLFKIITWLLIEIPLRLISGDVPVNQNLHYKKIKINYLLLILGIASITLAEYLRRQYLASLFTRP